MTLSAAKLIYLCFNSSANLIDFATLVFIRKLLEADCEMDSDSLKLCDFLNLLGFLPKLLEFSSSSNISS